MIPDSIDHRLQVLEPGVHRYPATDPEDEAAAIADGVNQFPAVLGNLLRRPEREQEARDVCETLRVIGDFGVPVVEWTWSIPDVWGLTRGEGRGGAAVRRFDYDSVRDVGPVEPDLASIEAGIFGPTCSGKCHRPPRPKKSLNLEAGASWSSLVGVPSKELPDMMRVAPGDSGWTTSCWIGWV